jgi:hypothetical protein
MKHPNTHVSYDCPKPFDTILQFNITLDKTRPKVWRMIQVPGCYSFWDLHCAISDAMGWLDEHDCHVFWLNEGLGAGNAVGLPNAVHKYTPPSWDTELLVYYNGSEEHEPYCEYVYNWPFGESLPDDWEDSDGRPVIRADEWAHEIQLVAVLDREDGIVYPRCIAGRNACPPEGCGGLSGYRRFLKRIKDPGHPEHAAALKSAGGWFNPKWFDPGMVRFEDPALRWKLMTEGKPLGKNMRQVQYHRMRSPSND